jgi:autotransporter-associated beta strand protein
MIKKNSLAKLVLLTPQIRQRQFSSTRIISKMRLTGLIFLAASFTMPGSASADTQDTFNDTATVLSVGANYTPPLVPTAAPTVDVQLAGAYTAGTTLTVAGTPLVFGTLNDLDTPQLLTITNTAGAGGIQLDSVANGTAGANAADLLFVAAGGNLTIQNGAGTFTLALNNTGNVDTAGTLMISSALTIANGNTVTFTGAGTTTVSGNIGATSGALAINNTGTVILSGANLYTGGTAVTAGTLAVGSTGALGTGSLLNNSILETTATPIAGATTTAPLTITVNGNYTQTANGTLLLQVASSPAPTPSMNSGVAGTNYDTLNAATATLGGTLDLNFKVASVPSMGQRYVAVTAGAPLATEFSTTVTNLATFNPSFFTVTTYNDTFGGGEPADSAIVTVLQPFATAGLTPNQMSVARNVDANITILNGSGALAMPTGAAADFFNNIVTGLAASTYSNGGLGEALDQLSPQRFEILRNVAFDNYAFDVQSLDNEFARERDGQGGIDTSGFALNDSALGPQLSQIKGRLLAWSPAPEAHGLLSDSTQTVLGGVEMSDTKEMKDVTPEQTLNKWNGFIDGGVDLADVDSNSDVSHSNYTTGRVRGGADYLIAQNFRVGAFFGYSHTDADLDNEGSKAHISSYTPGVFATYADKKGFYANGIFTYTRNDYSTDRDIIFPGVNRTATGSPSGDQFGGDLDGGYEFHKGNWTFGPSAGLTYVNLGIDSFNESGAGAANLSINSESAESLRSRLGGTVRYDAKIGSLVVTPHASAYWQHEFLDGGNFITSQFEGLPAGSFSVQTTPGDSDNALLDFGIDAEITNNLTLFVDYETEAGGETFFGQAATGGVRLNF